MIVLSLCPPKRSRGCTAVCEECGYALLAIHMPKRTTINETANVGQGHVPIDRVSGRRYGRTSQ